MTSKTLREAAVTADAELFTGRAAELSLVRRLLEADGPHRILYVHGSGGIGKSALLRAAVREATAAGYRVAAHDARTLPSELGSLVERVVQGVGAPRCIVIDEVDALGAALRPLRDAMLDSLDDSTRVVFAGRAAPEPSWRDDGLPGIVIDLPLRPLSDHDAADLLTASGIVDDARQREIVAWAQGSPLALTVAAAVPAGTPGSMEAELEGRLNAWLAGRSMLDVDPAVLDVAALVRTVDARLLAAALPGRSTRDAMSRLAALPVVERLGPGLTMHPALASAIRARLRAVAPGRYRELVRLIALHLGGRARLGDMDALIELSQFIETEEYRRIYSNPPHATHYADGPRPGELAVFARDNGFDQQPGWPELVAWDARPGHSFVLRRPDGAPLLYNLYANVAGMARLGRLSDGFLAAARGAGTDPNRTFAVVTMYADAPLGDRQEGSRLSAGAFMRRVALPELEAILLHFPEPNREPGLNESVSVPAHAEGDLLFTMNDFRPVGAVGFIEGLVLSEQGYTSRSGMPRDLLANDADADREERLRAVLDRAFGTSAEDRRLRRVIELAHLGPRRAEAELLATMHVSRPTWYRLLRRARERVLVASEEQPPNE